MRLLFTAAGGSGHIEPLVPLAAAAARRGHEVAFAVRPWMLDGLKKRAFAAFAAGSDTGLRPVRRPLVPYDLEAEMRAVGQAFAGRTAGERARDLLPIVDEWLPDLLVCEELDFGAMIAAERMELPHATLLVIGAGGFIRTEYVVEPLNAVRREHGLPPDADLAILGRHITLSPFPPSYRNPADPLPTGVRHFNVFATQQAMESEAPRWRGQHSDTPLLYFTLGTVFGVEAGDLYATVLAGLRELPVNVIATVGRDIDPTELGDQPPHVRVEQFVPQTAVLPYCDLVISHGGSGTVLGALAHGVPMVLLPLGADQPLNGARCRELGVGRALAAVTATLHDVRTAVVKVLRDDSYRQAAATIQEEIAALPPPAEMIPLLEQLA